MPSPGDQWCSVGTPNGGVAPNIVLGVADILLLLADAPLAITFLVEQLGLIPLITADFCATGAVYPGDPTAQDITDALNPLTAGTVLDKYKGIVLYYAWPHYCTCTTFDPPYVSRPAPPVWPTGLPDPTNLCSPVDMVTQLTAIQQLEQSLWLMVQLIAMRVGAMSYQAADVHSVTGRGELSVSSAIGVLVDGVTFQPGTGFDASDPARIYWNGWVTFGNSDGWEPRKAIWHDPQIFLGLTPGFQRIAFDCGNATSMTITELVPSVSGF